MAEIEAKPSVKTSVRSRAKRPSLPLAPEVQEELIESGEMDLAPEDAMAYAQNPEMKHATPEDTQEAASSSPSSSFAARLQEPLNRVRTYARERGLDIDRSVRARPWNYVIGAVLMGFIFGYRRRR